MTPLWTILRREYLERVRRRSFLIGTVLGPVFILGVTIIPAWLASRSTGKVNEIAVVDQTGALEGKLEQAFPDTLPGGSKRYRFEWEKMPPGADEARFREELQQRVLLGEYNGILWLPPDAIDGGSAFLYAQNLGDPEVGARLREGLSRAVMMLRLERRNIPVTETDAIAQRVPLKTYKLTKEGAREGGFEVDFMTGFLFAMILYMTLVIYGVGVQRSVTEDKNSRIVEVLLSSTRPFPLMLGKILGVGGVGLTQYAIWAVVAAAGTAYLRSTSPALAHVAALPPLTLAFFVLYFVLGYLLYAGIYAAVGAMVTTDQEAQQLQWPVTSLLIVPLIFLTSVLRDPDGTASVILSLIPFFTPILMLMRINLHTPPVWQLALSVVLLSLAVLAVAAVAARIFRIGILMYGKRPTLPEMIRWIRES